MQVAFAHLAGDFRRYGGYGFLAEVDGVGTHVGYVTGFIEPLCHHHGLRHCESEAPRGFLLESGRGEWGRRSFGVGFHCHIGHTEVCSGTSHEQSAAVFFRGQAVGKLGVECSPVAGGESGSHSPIRFADKSFYLLLTFHDETHGHALDASGRQCRLDFLPQHGRQLEAHDAVEHAPRLLRVHSVEVDAAWVGNGMEDGFFRDFMEHDPSGVLRFQSQHLVKMPCNGFSLAVFIGCEPHSLGFCRCFAQFAHKLLFLVRNFVDRAETSLHIYAEALAFEVAHMAVARHHFIVFAQKFLYGLCLGRRLDDD